MKTATACLTTAVLVMLSAVASQNTANAAPNDEATSLASPEIQSAALDEAQPGGSDATQTLAVQESSADDIAEVVVTGTRVVRAGYTTPRRRP